jgi:hypothetical protein
MRSEKHEFFHTHEKFHLLGEWQNELAQNGSEQTYGQG